MNRQALNRYTIAIIVLITLIAGVIVIASILLPNIYRISNAPVVNNQLVNLPKVDSVLYSSDDGSQHSFSINFTMAVDENIKEQLDTDTIHAKVTEIISGLDYDKVREKGGVDYVKTEVVRGLESYISSDQLKGLYVSNINSNNVSFEMPFGSPPPQEQETSNRPSLTEVLEGFGKRRK